MTGTVKFGTPQHFQMIGDFIRERGEDNERLRMALIAVMTAPHKDIEACRQIAREALGWPLTPEQ